VKDARAQQPAPSSPTAPTAPAACSIESALFRHLDVGAAQRRASGARQAVKKFMRDFVYVPEDQMTPRGEKTECNPEDKQNSAKQREDSYTAQKDEMDRGRRVRGKGGLQRRGRSSR
jgi:hypothetical protein